ncbi:MAG: ATP-binding cassette domain-containing protein, partial [Deltaproteobacteria bacterium]
MKILELIKVKKHFGGIKAVEDFSLSVEEGEIVGLIGPNGAGKSTLFNCVAGVYPPTTGEILFRGEKISGRKPWDLCHKGLARTFQIVKPFASKTVLYNVMVGAFATTDKRTEAEMRAREVLRHLNMEAL